MAVIWFSDEDRERMRREREAVLERAQLFWEFVREEEPFGVANRDEKGNPRMETLDIRPWTARPGDEH
jgi:hypothetical protein